VGEVSNTRRESRSDIVCLEGNGARPSHRGDGYRVGGCLSLKCIAIENHPNDSRVKIREDGICQSLTSRMGTGGQHSADIGDK